MHTILSIFISLSLLGPAFLPMASQFSVLAENESSTESGNPSPDASMPDASNPDAASDASGLGKRKSVGISSFHPASCQHYENHDADSDFRCSGHTKNFLR